MTGPPMRAEEFVRERLAGQKGAVESRLLWVWGVSGWGRVGGAECHCGFSLPVLFHNTVTKETRLVPEPCSLSCLCLCDSFSSRVCVCVLRVCAASLLLSAVEVCVTEPSDR